MERGAQRGVADQHGRVGLLHHHPQVGRAGEVVGPDPVLLGKQQLGEAYRRTGGRAQSDAGSIELLQRDLRNDHAGHHGTVAADREVGEGDELVGVAEELHEGDRGDVELARDEALTELFGGVLGQLQVQQRAGSGQPPVERQAVQELDVADAGPAAIDVHIARLAPGSTSAFPRVSNVRVT